MTMTLLYPFSLAATLCLTTSAAIGNLADANIDAVELIPREVFFGDPERAAVTISPDGQQLAFLAPHEGVLNVWVQSVGKDDARPVTRSTDRPIRIYRWAENSEQIIYSQDRGGDENFRIYAVTLPGERDVEPEEIELTPFDNVQARIVETDRDHPDTILAAINNRNPQLHDVWRINTRTGERELILENNEGWAGFIADANLEVRVATRMTPDGGAEAVIREANGEAWRPLARWDAVDTLTSGPLAFARDGKALYMLDSRGVDTGGLYKLDLTTDTRPAEVELELLFRSDRADVSGAMIDPKTGEPQAVSYTYARKEWRILDERIRKDFEYLRGISAGDFEVTSRSNADNRWIVAYIVDDGPVRYYFYDREAQRAEFLFTNQPALEGLPLVNMEPVIIEARDGLQLVSYLTRPAVGRQTNGQEQRANSQQPKADSPLPMVLLVHGGPWARDSWGYNPLHQWLANRGYAVLSVNFRGSTGFGKSFVNAGNREWAGKMHDDLIDAVNWAVEKGIADKDRIAIMGGSYGGYATLVGLTFTPDVFAAGVDIVGPSHIRTLLESIPPYWKPIISMFETRVGALSEPEYLDSISPLTKVDNITKPLLIGQGANDPRVKEAESEQIVEAMQQRDIPVTYVVFPDEGHGFARPVNRLAFFAITEAFLAQHLGGNYEPLSGEVATSTAKVPEGAELIPGLAEAAN